AGNARQHFAERASALCLQLCSVDHRDVADRVVERLRLARRRNDDGLKLLVLGERRRGQRGGKRCQAEAPPGAAKRIHENSRCRMPTPATPQTKGETKDAGRLSPCWPVSGLADFAGETFPRSSSAGVYFPSCIAVVPNSYASAY